jgi:hypothetical protein
MAKLFVPAVVLHRKHDGVSSVLSSRMASRVAVFSRLYVGPSQLIRGGLAPTEFI